MYKKRVALGKGKSGGARTLLAYKQRDRAFFLYGFARNVRADIRPNELKALKLLARQYFMLNTRELSNALDSGALVELVVH